MRQDLFIRSPSGEGEKLQGWTSSPNNRGTFDILWSCLVTLGLCCWTVLCINIPDPRERGWKVLLRKCVLAAVCLGCPEGICGIAASQFASAWESVKEFRDLRVQRQQDGRIMKAWTMRHAFYAEMGGYVLRLQNGDNESRFVPLDAQQLFFLVKENAFSQKMEEESIFIDLKRIKDRNKADTIIRVLAMTQACYFVVTCLARVAQGLALSTLELSTLALFVPGLFSGAYWFYKPADVATTEVLEINESLDEILRRSERFPANYAFDINSARPLDFLSRKEHLAGILFQYWTNLIISFNVIPNYDSTATTRRTNRSTARPAGFQIASFAGVSIIFLGLNFAAWNFQFPTQMEQLLWRLAASIMALTFITQACTCVITDWKYSHQYGLSKASEHEKKINELEKKLKTSGFLMRLVLKVQRRIIRLGRSPNGDPELEVSAKSIIFATIIASIYTLARISTYVEDIVALRALPASAYETVDWSSFFPHAS